MEIKNIRQATPAEISALQEKSLEILLYYQQFCEQHGLLFYLCGGCCIGAVRHGGFIPWDDDIDVFMPRDDYEKLAVLWPRHADTKRYSYCRTGEFENYHNIGASIRDNNTAFINVHSKDEDINHGLMIDIIPLDGCPDSFLRRMQQMFFAMLYSLFNAQRLPDNQGRFLRLMSALLLNLVYSPTLRYRIWRFAEKKMTRHRIGDCRFITELASGFRYLKNKYPKGLFEHAVKKNFAGHSLPLPIGYDVYLKMAFGDYMQFPPVDKRIAKHNTIYINLNTSYQSFKGIYYCREGEDV